VNQKRLGWSCVLLAGMAASLAGCGASRLVSAAEAGRTDDVRALLDDGVDVNATEFGRTALFFAAQEGHTDLVKMLLKRGAHVNHQYKGITALHLAAERGYASVIKVLLHAGADPSIKMDEYGSLPIHQACFNGHISATMALSEAGDGLDARNTALLTPLHMATLYHHRTLVERLLQRGAKVNARDNEGWTPLHYACRIWTPDTISILLAHGADASGKIKHGRTALHLAAMSVQYGQSQVPGAPDSRKVHRGTPSGGGDVQRGSPTAVHKGAPPGRAGVDHSRAVVEAIIDPVYARVRVALAKAGCDTSARDKFGQTADEIYADHRREAAWRSTTIHSFGMDPMLQFHMNSALQQYQNSLRQNR